MSLPKPAEVPLKAESAIGVTASDLPEIVIGPDEHRVVDETVMALRRDPDLYKRGNVLVQARMRDPEPGQRQETEGGYSIVLLPEMSLRERITKNALLLRAAGQAMSRCHPPSWLVKEIFYRGEWQGIRHLLGISDAPVLRPDGSVWQTPGYDPQTHVLYLPSIEFGQVPASPTREDARAAVDVIREVVCDFPFASDAHFSAYMAGLLSPLARTCYSGPAPLFLVDANTPAAGKGLLVQTIAVIVSGRQLGVTGYAHESEEMRKKITAIAMAGDSMVLLDNLTGNFGNDAIDRALTGARWKERLITTPLVIDVPLLSTWYATGNNVTIVGDTPRRIIHIRLDLFDDDPDRSSRFVHKELLSWISENRGRLVAAALTIVAAYLKAGQPPMNLVPMPSFEGWSFVRSALVWAGLADPYETTKKLSETCDTSKFDLEELLLAWRTYVPDGRSLRARDFHSDLYPDRPFDSSQEPGRAAMRVAIENMIRTQAGKPPTSKQIGKLFGSVRRKLAGGLYVDIDTGAGDRTGLWWVLRARTVQEAN